MKTMDLAEINLSKSIIKKKKVSYMNDQYLVHSGAGKIISDFILQKEKEKQSEAKELQALGGGHVADFVEVDTEVSSFLERNNKSSVSGKTLSGVEHFRDGQVPGTKGYSETDYSKIEIDYSGIIKQEYDKGFESGKKSAVKLMENEFKKKISKGIHDLTTLLDSIKEEFEEYKLQFDKSIISLSIAIAEKIVKREVALNDDTVILQIKDAINKVIGVENITININPQDEEMLRLHKNELMNKYDSIKELHIHSNDKIEKGSCKIESHLGNVDARLSTQLKIIEDALLENIKINRKNETD
jgi:flagellar assembly protein FliH